MKENEYNEILDETDEEKAPEMSKILKCILKSLELLIISIVFDVTQYFLLSFFISFANIFVRLLIAAISIYLIFREYIKLQNLLPNKWHRALYLAINIIILAVFILLVGYLKIDAQTQFLE